MNNTKPARPMGFRVGQNFEQVGRSSTWKKGNFPGSWEGMVNFLDGDEGGMVRRDVGRR